MHSCISFSTGLALLSIVAGCASRDHAATPGQPAVTCPTTAPVSTRPTDAQEVDRMTDEIMTGLVEEDLDHWKPKGDALREPASAIRSPEVDILGEWTVHRGLDLSTLSITPSDRADYQVEFATSGCLFHYRLHRTGTYSNGVLTLNRPVEEYFPLTYQKLYAVRIAGQEWLLPAAAIPELEKGLSADGTKVSRVAAGMYLFQRKPRPTTTAAAR